MTLLAPIALGLTALSGPVILMYILKLRRQPQVVSSTFLWRKAVDDVQANAPWQRLRISALLILQLLALLALVLAETRPAYSSPERFSGDLIVIVDQSFGMQATDVKPSRFAAALSDAKSLASQVPSGNVVSIIGMAAHPTLAIAEGTDQGAIDAAVDGLKDGYSQPNFLEALSLASSLARSGQATHVVVLTSRQSGITSLPLQTPFPVKIIRIGGHLRDLGIGAFGANQTKGGVSALVRVDNYGSSRASTDLNFYVDGQLTDVRPLTLAAGAETTQFWNNLPLGSDILHVTLSARDDVTSDKQAWTVVSSGETRRILLVSAGDFFLQTALTINPSVRLTVEAPSKYASGQASHFDMVVFDGFLPSSLPAAPALIISPPPGAVGSLRFGSYLVGGTVSPNAQLLPAMSPLIANVEVSDVVVARERALTIPGWMQSVYLRGSQTLIAAGEKAGRRLAVAAFSLQDSNWPLRISFPILVQNLVSYLVPSVGVSATSITAGDSVGFAPEPGVKQIDVTLPDGSLITVRKPFPPLTDTGTPGVYTVREAGRKFAAHFVANLLPPRPAPATGPRVLTLGKASAGGSTKTSIPADIGWLAAFLCLGFLGAEWWLAFRR